MNGTTRAQERAKMLLSDVQKELRSIPKLPTVKSDPTLADAVLTTPTAAVQLLRRGIRLLRGGESSEALEAKQRKLEGYIQKIEDMKKTAYRIGDDKYVDYLGKPVDPSSKSILTTKEIGSSSSQALKKKAMNRMKGR
jgi:hypothetical protein